MVNLAIAIGTNVALAFLTEGGIGRAVLGKGFLAQGTTDKVLFPDTFGAFGDR